MCLVLVELAPGCSDGAIVKWHLPEQKQCEDSCGITLETAKAGTKGGTSQYELKNRSGHEQEQTPEQKNSSSTSEISQAPEQEPLHGGEQQL